MSAVSIARSEQSSGPPRAPADLETQFAVASSLNQIVTSPRARSPCSYSRQFLTRYSVLYAGWTRLDFTAGMRSVPHEWIAKPE